MDGSELAKPAPRRKWNRYEWLALALLVFFFLGLTGLDGLVVAPVKAAFFLVAGWIWFLARVVPEMHFNWAAIVMFLVCSALVIGGLQWVGRTLAEKGGWAWSQRWPWGIYLGCWILFLAAMGFAGAVHQIGWLFSSGEPWVESGRQKFYEFHEMKQTGVDVRLALHVTRESPDQVRTIVVDESRLYRDTCTVLCFPADAGPVRTVLVLPRSPEVLRRFGFVRIEADGSSREEPGNRLAPTLDRLNAGNFEPLPQP